MTLVFNLADGAIGVVVLLIFFFLINYNHHFFILLLKMEQVFIDGKDINTMNAAMLLKELQKLLNMLVKHKNKLLTN
jgi:hypothetical protein